MTPIGHRVPPILEVLPQPTPINHRAVGLLGVLTICSYGAWYYAFGALIDPILVDTGWRESSVAFSFSLGLILIGVGSPLGGILLDRLGHRWVYAIGGTVGSAGLLLASISTNLTSFTAAAAIGMGVYGALGFYHTSMSTVVRLHPHNGSRAIAVLTLWGAASSAIFLPATAWLTAQFGWRTASQILTMVTAAAFWGAVIFVPSPPVEPGEPSTSGPQSGNSGTSSTRVGDTSGHPPIWTSVQSLFAPGQARLFTLTVAAVGIAISTLLAYQVPVMVAAGLPAGLAASLAGARGLMQLSGRIPLGRIVSRVGSDATLIIACGAIAASGLALRFSAMWPLAVLFVGTAGFGIGAFSPLQGIKSTELFAAKSLGTTMGLYGAIAQIVGAGGPALAGVVADSFGGRELVPFIVVSAALVGAASATRGMRVAGAGPGRG